jgi:ssDNA-binding Zn-finger/Zn-ribbon topoisomerase 1
MILRTSKDSRYPKSGKPRKYYGCARYPKCDIVCGAHPDGTPLGIPGDGETRKSRYELHAVFDQLWISQRWSRQEAYYILQILTGLDCEEAHIANFDKKKCLQVMGLLKEFHELNPVRVSDSKIRVPSWLRFIYVLRECPVHGKSRHQVYLETRKVFCQDCVDSGVGSTWKEYKKFKGEK